MVRPADPQRYDVSSCLLQLFSYEYEYSSMNIMLSYILPWEDVLKRSVYFFRRARDSFRVLTVRLCLNSSMVFILYHLRFRGGWPKPRPILESAAATGVTTWRQHWGRPGHWQSRGG